MELRLCAPASLCAVCVQFLDPGCQSGSKRALAELIQLNRAVDVADLRQPHGSANDQDIKQSPLPTQRLHKQCAIYSVSIFPGLQQCTGHFPPLPFLL